MFAPASSRYKIYIIDEAHMVTPPGFNALLKLVEEPPEHVRFIFATTEAEKVLPTIRSRTHNYTFRLVPLKVLQQHQAAQISISAIRTTKGLKHIAEHLLVTV
jgi:DNA polymerase-3 subunit gamma/tau